MKVHFILATIVSFPNKRNLHFGGTFSLSSLRKLLATGESPPRYQTSIIHDILITLATGVPGGVGDSEWIVSRRLVTRALDPADCFKVNWTLFVTVEPPSCSRTACTYLVHLGFFTPFCKKKKSYKENTMVDNMWKTHIWTADRSMLWCERKLEKIRCGRKLEKIQAWTFKPGFFLAFFRYRSSSVNNCDELKTITKRIP